MGDRLNLGGLRHLAARFAEVLGARPLSPRQQSEVAALLRQPEWGIFWSQPAADQLHGLRCARHVLRHAPGDLPLARAALLHDVGKQVAGSGALGRVGASVLGMLAGGAPGRWGRYLAHGEIGARLLEEAGAEAAVLSFARHHHGSRPEGWDPEQWALLEEADRAAKDTGWW